MKELFFFALGLACGGFFVWFWFFRDEHREPDVRGRIMDLDKNSVVEVFDGKKAGLLLRLNVWTMVAYFLQNHHVRVFLDGKEQFPPHLASGAGGNPTHPTD